MPIVGVEFYKTGTAVLPVHFPEGKTDCRHCHYLRYVENRHLHYCGLTEVYIEQLALDDRHPACPVIFEEKENEF